ncbi:MAG: NADH-quinone oxidoreductase subunit [Phycisphaerales bacterium]|jgi:NADH-quinone oxidoreductase subunit H|nr:NADH-quinone oxidoreductase subunit [Phycisphaerales bacterium]
MLDQISEFAVTHPWLWIALVAHFGILGTVAYMILLERKIASWVQDRIGPNRVGLGFGIIPWLKDKKMFGLGQPLADGLKFLLKEDYHAKNVDKILFTLAPMLMIAVIIVSIAVLPFGGVKQTTRAFDVTGAADPVAAAVQKLPIQSSVVTPPAIQQSADGRTLATVTYRYPFMIADLDIGILFILAVLSLAVYGVVIGGWASNNKYSFLGGLRATANMISYEIPLGLSALAVLLLFGTLNLNEIVDKQAHYWAGFIPAWNVFIHPLAFLMFLICIHAEANRAPFDTAEAEQELVGGYHTEYSSMRFALFFLAEYAGMITTSAVCVALFFGGWHFPGLGGHVDPASPAVTDSLLLCIVRAIVFFTKTLIIIGVFMWVRWSLPRFRFDQIMNLAWRALIPISLILVLATAVTVWALGPQDRPYMRVNGTMAAWLLGVNVVTLIVIMLGSKLIPAAPDTNRRVRIPGSRFNTTALPAGTATATVAV